MLLGLTCHELEPLLGGIERHYADVVQIMLLYEGSEDPRG